MNFPADLKYTKSHEWAKIDNGIATIGITDFAQDSLGDVVYFDMPEVGDSLSAGDTLGEVESVKAVSDVYTPLSGEIVEVNDDLNDTPELVNEDPYGKGWVIKLRLTDPAEAADLLDMEAYQKNCEGE